MTEEPALDFAGLLRQLRAAARLTQEELAEAAGLSPRTVSDLERGVNRTAHKETAGLLADALRLAGPVRGLFVAAARGRASAAQVLAARAEAPTALAAAVIGGLPGPLPRRYQCRRSCPRMWRRSPAGRLSWPNWTCCCQPAGQQTGAAPGPVVISAVSGTAGVGKTALAVRWAHRVAAAVPGRAAVCEPARLRPRPAGAGQPRRWPGSCGRWEWQRDIPLEEAERAARYRSLVAGKRLLVVLDNAATAEQVRPLLPGSWLGDGGGDQPGFADRAGCPGRRPPPRSGSAAPAEAVALLSALIGPRPTPTRRPSSVGRAVRPASAGAAGGGRTGRRPAGGAAGGAGRRAGR